MSASYGSTGDDTLPGTPGDDAVFGGPEANPGADIGADSLSGDAGADTIYGLAGADTLRGGTGNDALDGGGEADRFIYEAGDGDDTISTAGFDFDVNDRLVLGAGITTADVTVTQENGTDFLLAIAGGGSIRLAGSLASGFSRVDFVEFADGTVWDVAQLLALSTTSNGGNDAFNGSDLADTLDGGAGADTLRGANGADTLRGGTGNDSLDGGGEADRFVYEAGDGDDTISTAGFDFDVNDRLLLGAGITTADVTVTQENGTDFLLAIAGGGSILLAGSLASGLSRVDFVEFADGTVWDVARLLALSTTSNGGNDAFNGSDLADTLDGGAGADTLLGGSGADTLRGGTGNDALDGGGEADRFIYEAGDGDDTISTAGFDFDVNDRLLLGAGITTADVTVTQENGTDFLLAIAGGGSIRLAGSLASALARVDFVEFADGTVWDVAQLLALSTTSNGGNDAFIGSDLADTLDGGAGADTLLGGSGTDTLRGGTGNDALDGGGEADRFIYEAGDGDDTISTAGFDFDVNDRLLLGAGITTADVTVTQENGTDFLLAIAGGGSIRLAGSLASALARVDFVEFADGTVWTQANLLARSMLANSGNDSFYGDENDNTLDGGAGGDTLLAGVGADTLDGGTGNDSLLGGAGNDVFLYDLGDGNDTINDFSFDSPSHDRLVLGAGILTSQVTVAQGGAGDDFILTMPDGSTVTLLISLTNSFGRIEEVEFADGTTWDQAALLARSIVDNAGHDAFSGDEFDNPLAGGAGNDTISANSGADSITGGTGNDLLLGAYGADRYYYALGDGSDTISDSAIGDSSTDRLVLGAGILTSHVAVSQADGGSDFVLTLAGGATIRLDGGLGQAENRIEEVEFADGTIWDHAELLARSLIAVATTGDDNILGDASDNGLDGLGGNDTIAADAGADTIAASGGNDSVDGGTGTDCFVLTGSRGDYAVTQLPGGAIRLVDLRGGSPDGTDIVIAVEEFAFSDQTLSAAQVLVGVPTVSGDRILGGSLDDGIEGLDGNDTIYGQAGADTLAGGSGNDILVGGAGVDRMVGGSGNDVFYVDDAADAVEEAAGEGTDWILSSVTLTLGTAVENLTLTGGGSIDGTGNTEANRITGNAGANRLSGSGGNDTLTGGLGADTLEGGSGNDVFYVDDGGDLVTEAAGEGTDWIFSSVTVTLGAAVENLILTGTADIDGTGNTGANRITGNAGANRLSGSGGNDTITGGAGADTLEGGTGNDAFYVDEAGDEVVELAGEGTDVVLASIDYALGAAVENLSLTGTVDIDGTGNTEANRITGNAGANRLSGSGGNDTITGGAGADTLEGGTGNDVFYVDEAGDEVVELAGEGTDVVLASLNYALGAAVENLSLTGTADIDGTGNTEANRITGNAGANRLSGSGGNDTLTGGLGADTLEGGAGNDVFYVDDGGDLVTEAAGEGTDWMFSSVTVTLGAGVENLILTGTADIDGTGNTEANRITGNAGANRLSGSGGNDTITGGAGADTQEGGTGNDAFYVDEAGDEVVELAGEGTDVVLASIDYALGAAVENLSLTGTADLDGTGNTTGNSITGNAGANRMEGLSGNDTLAGAGGADTLDGGGGVDRLSGGIGADVFRFQSLAESPASSPDTVADFVRGEDLLDVSAIDPRADAGDQDFAWIGGAAFDGLGVAQARTWQLGLETYVGFDIGDGGSAELVIRLSGLLAMTADDLIL